MGKVFYTPDGKAHTSVVIDDLFDVVSVYCGQDIADEISGYVMDEVCEAEQVALIAEQEQEAAEGRLEEVFDALRDARDTASELADYLEGEARWKKEYVLDKVRRIERRANEDL